MNSYNQLTVAISLPQPKVPVFKGDSTEYASFVTAFNARIESKVTNDSDRLYYLNQHLEGEPKDLIEGCLHLEPTEGYTVLPGKIWYLPHHGVYHPRKPNKIRV